MAEAERHYVLNANTAISLECRLGAVARVTLKLVKPHKKVKEGKATRTLQSGPNLVNLRQNK